MYLCLLVLSKTMVGFWCSFLQSQLINANVFIIYAIRMLITCACCDFARFHADCFNSHLAWGGVDNSPLPLFYAYLVYIRMRLLFSLISFMGFDRPCVGCMLFCSFLQD